MDHNHFELEPITRNGPNAFKIGDPARGIMILVGLIIGVYLITAIFNPDDKDKCDAGRCERTL